MYEISRRKGNDQIHWFSPWKRNKEIEMESIILAFLILGLLVVFAVDTLQKRNNFLTKMNKNNGG